MKTMEFFESLYRNTTDQILVERCREQVPEKPIVLSKMGRTEAS